ncbi:Nn.00g002980.m01.CDS01 [Neocucurbitaria sp. VM-36]
MGDSYFRETRFWKRTPKFYPNVLECIGAKIGFFHDRHWWHATGQAREEFKSVELDILEQLKAIFTDSYSSIIHFHLYMIGRSAELARPTIMVFCEEKEPRKKAKKAIEEGGILEKLQGFRIGHQARQPEVGLLIQPATEGSGPQEHGLPSSAPDVYFDPSRPVQAFGMPIFKCVYMMISHVFLDNTQFMQNATTNSDSEYDFGSGREVEDDDDCMEITSCASISSPGESLDDRPDSASPESGSSTWTNDHSLPRPVLSEGQSSSALPMARANTPMEQGLSDRLAVTSTPSVESLEYLGCLTRLSRELDWALVEIKNPKVYARVYELKSSAQSVDDAANQQTLATTSQAIAHTSHGTIYGTLSDNASYMRLPGSITFQKVYQIALDAPLDWGDCGVGVSNASTTAPCGHVVATSMTKGIAYIVAAPQVMKDSGTQWDISSMTDVTVALSKTESQELEAKANPLIPSTVSQAPTVLPMRTHGSLPYDHFIPPLLQSIGKSLDPFRTSFSQQAPQVSVEELKFHYSRYFRTRGMEKQWMPKILDTPHAFLGTLCVASTHHDVVNEQSFASLATVALRQELIHAIGRNLLDPRSALHDSHVITLVQLIASEVIGGENTSTSWHEAGLETMIKTRGGFGQFDKVLASMISWIALESAIISEAKPGIIYHHYSKSVSSKTYPLSSTIPESPLYNPRGRYVTRQRSTGCEGATLDILNDIRMLLDVFIHEKMSRSGRSPQTVLNLYRKITSDYMSLSQMRQAKVLRPSDWRYAAIRLTSFIQAHAIARRLPLSQALVHVTAETESSFLNEIAIATSAPSEISVPPTDSDDNISVTSNSRTVESDLSFFSESSVFSNRSTSTSSSLGFLDFTEIPFPPRRTYSVPLPGEHESSHSEDLLRSLKTALERSNLSSCWDDMAGVLLWIALTAAAASRRVDYKPLRNYFAALAVRVSDLLCFQHPEAIHATLLRMGELIEGLSPPNSGSKEKQV